jgi:hypothetical protein
MLPRVDDDVRPNSDTASEDEADGAMDADDERVNDDAAAAAVTAVVASDAIEFTPTLTAAEVRCARQRES